MYLHGWTGGMRVVVVGEEQDTLVAVLGPTAEICGEMFIMTSALLKMGRYYNTTMCHYWDMLVK